MGRERDKERGDAEARKRIEKTALRLIEKITK